MDDDVCDGGAGERVERTNSGDSILEMCVRNWLRQGAGGAVRWWVVLDMVRRSAERRWWAGEAMVVERERRLPWTKLQDYFDGAVV